MRPTSYLAITFSLVVATALVVAFFLDDTKTVVTYLAIFGGLAAAIGAVMGVVRGEHRERS